MFYKVVIILINVLYINGEDKETIIATKDLDYTGLAGEAEIHKQDILSFLNEPHVRDQYKALYNCLLSKLMGKQM